MTCCKGFNASSEMMIFIINSDRILKLHNLVIIVLYFAFPLKSYSILLNSASHVLNSTAFTITVWSSSRFSLWMMSPIKSLNTLDNPSLRVIVALRPKIYIVTIFCRARTKVSAAMWWQLLTIGPSIVLFPSSFFEAITKL